MALQPPLSPSALGVLAERLGPLPLVNHFLSRIGLLELLEHHVPTADGRSTLSHAQALGVLLRSIIVEREPIYRQQESANGFAAGLFGGVAAQATRLCDDRIGLALARLCDADRAALRTVVVLAVAQRFSVRSIPTLILFKSGQVQGQKVGAPRKPDLVAFLDSKL